jgi:hypothetical protein
VDIPLVMVHRSRVAIARENPESSESWTNLVGRRAWRLCIFGSVLCVGTNDIVIAPAEPEGISIVTIVTPRD